MAKEKEFIELSDGVNYRHKCDNYALFELRDSYGICVEVVSCHKCDEEDHTEEYEYFRVGNTMDIKELKHHPDRIR